MYKFDIGNKLHLWSKHLVEVLLDVPPHLFAWSCYNFVAIVQCIVQTWNVDTLVIFIHVSKKFALGHGVFQFFVVVDDLLPRGFAFANEHKVEVLVHWLQIDGAWATSNDKWEVFATLGGGYGDAGKFQHVEDVGVAHFVLDGKANKVEVCQRCLCFQTSKGQVIVLEVLFVVGKGRVATVAHHTINAVEKVVQNAHAQIGHAHFVAIGNAHTKAHVRRFVDIWSVEFSAKVTIWFLDGIG